TLPLIPGSAAIDMGMAVAGLTTDQRGFQRPVDLADVANAPGGNASDIGAFERQESEVSVPGTQRIDNVRVSDQKAGSVLVFPYYTSDLSGNFFQSDTLITITNVANGESRIDGIPNYQYLHLFFMKDCSPADTFACLTPNGSLQILASTYDPGTTGYLIAIAVDVDGIPIQNNSFIGSAFVRDQANGIIDSYGAEAFASLNSAPVPQSGGNAIIALDDVNYEAPPQEFSVQLQDPALADQTIVLASVGGDLGAKMNSISQASVGLLYRADETPASFQPSLGSGCFITRSITNQSIRIVPGSLSSFLKDSYGYIKFNVSGPAVGLLFSRQGASGQPQNRFAGIRTLHKTNTGYTALFVPVFPPFCI
ncbi:MAG TPA: choice-of-anchor Q domain-containing protein, partial [Blastocatellia bacterium]|nr:choice-of-anchor Q domain-containing protein [Blastocatellia bacterium]